MRPIVIKQYIINIILMILEISDKYKTIFLDILDDGLGNILLHHKNQGMDIFQSGWNVYGIYGFL